MRSSECVCVCVCVYTSSIKKSFLEREVGGYSSQVSHNQKRHSSPRSNKCNGISNLAKKNNLSIIPKQSQNHC